VRKTLALLALVPLAVGCSGTHVKAGPSGGATIAPASTALFVRVASTPHAYDVLEPLVPKSLEPQLDALKEVVGPETDLLELDPKTQFLLTQPPSQAKLDSLLAKQKPALVSEQIGSWTVVARSRSAIDRLKRARNAGSLASSSAFKEATSGLPPLPLVSFYADGAAVSTSPVPGIGRVAWASGVVGDRPGGLHVQVQAKGDEIEPLAFKAELPAEIPTPVSLLVDLKGADRILDELKRSPTVTKRLGTIGTALQTGVLDDLIGLLRGETAVYARPLPKGPEYTLLARIADPAAAQSVIDRLAILAGTLGPGAAMPVQVDGIKATKLKLGKTTVYAAVVSDKLVLTSAATGIRGAAGMGPHLADSPLWKATATRAGLPDETAGIFYADLGRVLPLLATLAGDKPPSGPSPLGRSMLYATVDGSVLVAQGFVGLR
jgi:hypothetical protein